MKKVFSSSSQVFHIYAQRTQSEGRSSNVFFYNEKIYSYGYHYELARFVDNDTHPHILINNSGYSNTTAKHISEIIQATRQYEQYFTKDIDLDLVYHSITDNYKKLLSARKPEIYINAIIDKYESLINYPLFLQSTKLSDKFKEIETLYHIVNNFEDLEKAKEFAKVELAKKAKEAKEKTKIDLEKFYNHEIDYKRGNEDFIRISKDLQSIESSQRVQVGIEDAKNLYEMILANQDIKGQRVGNYTVISINGVLTIGCHRINMESVHKVGKQILNF